MADLPTLYHGTRAAFSGRGGIVVPGSEAEAPSNFPHLSPSRRGYVYVTTDVDLAWEYAERCQGDGKPRVLVVRPHGLLTVDDSTIDGDEQEAYACEWATVERVISRREVPAD